MGAGGLRPHDLFAGGAEPSQGPTTIEEKEGFELSELSLYSFQDCRLRPLGHFSGLTNFGTYALGAGVVNLLCPHHAPTGT